MRSRLIAVAALRGTSLLLTAVPTQASTPAALDNPIVLENQQTGSSGWLPGPLIASDAIGQIKGFTSAASVSQNESITLFVTVNPAQTYTIDIYRIGWYGGSGARLRLHAGPLDGIQQSACPPDAVTGLIACDWTPSYTLTVPADWTSGVYLVHLINAQGYENYAIFVVRDGRPASFLYQQSVATDQAYNNYPDDGSTGKSLYPYNSYGANTVAGDRRAVKVSFDRPYSGFGVVQFFEWEAELVRWLERSGYDVTYANDLDAHARGGPTPSAKGILFGGHSEYWSKEMFDGAEAARDAGVNLAFFGADAITWQVRFEASASSIANRVMVAYKNPAIDPVQGPTTTALWRFPPLNRPEQVLRGVMSNAGQVNFANNAGYVVTNSSHWVYEGTGFKDGDVVPGIVGYEMDHFWPDAPAPNSSDRTLLSHSPFTDDGGHADYANSSIYQAPSGAWVFATGTMSWSWGLDNLYHNLADARIQRTTANVLAAFLNGAPTAASLKVTAPPTVTAGEAFNVTVAAVNAQGNPVTSYRGTVHFGSSDTATGVVLPADSGLTAGQGTFAVTLATAGPQTLTVSDTANSLSASVNVTVTAGPADHFALATSSVPNAGTSFSFTMAALDRFGNAATGYTGRVHLTGPRKGT